MAARSFLARGLLLVLVLAVGLAVPSPAQAGRLNRARTTTRGSSGTKSSPASRPSVKGYRGSGLGFGWWPALFGPWLDGSGTAPSPQFAYATAPYAGGFDGYLRIEGQAPPLAELPDGRELLGNGGAVRIWLEGGADGQDLLRGSGGLLWSGHHGLEVGLDLRRYSEQLAGGSVDTQWMGTASLSYQAITTPNAQGRIGFGVRWMDNVEGASGGQLSAGLDLFPCDPLVLSLHGDVGFVGEARVLHGRATAGVMLGALEVYGGYDLLAIEEVDLGTWTAGVRLWQ